MNPANILLADDEEEERFMFKIVFEELDKKTIIHTVNNGIQLMSYLRREGVNLPDIIFLDINMPHKNGLECLDEIRETEKLKDTLVVIYSNSSAIENIEGAFKKGANLYVIKQGKARVRKILFNILTIDWKEHAHGANREKFLLME